MEDIKIDGLSADEWETLANPSQPTNEELNNLGIIQQPQQDTSIPPDTKPKKVEREDYEELGYWQTIGDEALAATIEASRFFVPKKYELNYTPRTRAGEAYKTFFKYLLGVGGLFAGGEVAAGARGLAMAANAPRAAKIAGGAEAILKGNKFFKTSSTGLKAIGVNALNIGTQGVLQGAILDATIHDADEGRIVDMFGETNNKFIDWLQTDPNDSVAEAKLKNVIDGALFSIGINGVFSVAEPILGRVLSNVKFLKNTKPAEAEAAKVTEEIIKDEVKLSKIADTADIVNTVKELKENSDDASEAIINTFHPDNIEDAQNILKILEDGDDIIIHEDGTFAIKVSKWDDAYKVSPEEYKRQLAEADQLKADSFGSANTGDTALSHQDEAVRDTWTNRGWIGENEQLNQKTANKIIKNYKDKFKIDNNVKVEFVDGLKVDGKAVEGNTSATTFLGKIAKNKQNAIDKKALQVQKLKDKVTMLEGGNEPVMEALDAAKEELRIAENELKELKKTATGKNLKPNITIQIDKNAQNPYATLRAEIEHARDIAKGEVPNQSEKHFARYDGMNEGEVASEYTYKKSVGKNKALKQTKEAEQIKANNQEAINNGYSFNKSSVDTFSGDGTRIEMKNPDGKAVGYLDYTVDGDTVHIEQIMNSSHKTDYYEKGVAYKLVDNILSEHPNKHIQWDATTPQGRAFKEKYLKEHPEVKARTTGISTKEELDKLMESEYNSSEGIINEGNNRNNWKQPLESRNRENQGIDTSKGRKDSSTEWNNGSNGDLSSSNISTNARGENTFTGTATEQLNNYHDNLINEVETNFKSYRENLDKQYQEEMSKAKSTKKKNQIEKAYKDRLKESEAAYKSALAKAENRAEQLKLNFNTTVSSAQTAEELVENITSGTAKVADIEDVGTVLNKTIELDAEISGTTWEAIAKDADKIADVMLAAEDLGLNKELAEALSMNDVKTMDEITRKVLAAQKLSSQLGDRLANLGKNPPMEQMKSVIDLIDTISRYTKETGSASGRSLQARKFINKAIETFGSLRLSQLTKEGINTVSDLLSVEINKIIDLNFTKGAKLTPQQMKQQLMEGLLQNTDSPFIQLLADDKELASKFDSILDDLFSGNGKVTPKNVYSKLEDAITEARYKEVFNATQLAETPETKAKVISKWCDAQGGMTSFYIHNLLSGVGTLAKNVISGGLNTAYFPAKKIVAGYLGGGEAMVKEGWNTYKNLMSGWREAWSLGKQAFLNGEGQLSMMRDTMALADGEVFNGFREWNFDFSTPEGIWHSIQNFHSMMTRAMGASDEFMSQLNYRAIKRAKALEQADNLAKQYNITDEAVKNNIADKIFQNAFDNAGKPLDVDTLAEAKDILYQLPLNGQVFDRAVGEMKQVRPQTWVTQVAGGLNSGAAKNPVLKIMFPFVKTGANILQQNLEHNGIYAVLSNSQRQLLMANTREGALARSQVAFGMFSFITAAGLAMSGMITGSAPTDKKERAALFETGWKPYSIRIGNQYVSYQGYEPIQTICGFAADSVNILGNIANSEDEAKWEKFSQQVLAASVNNFLDKAAFRTGLRQLAFMTSPDENIDEFKKSLAQTAQGFLPDSSMVRSISSVGKRSVTAPQSPYERILNNYFNRGLGDYRRDVFGNRQDNVGLLVTNVAPDNASQPEYEEMEYLSQFGFSPSDISKTIKDTTLKYTEFKDPDTGRSVYDTMQEELSTIEIDGKTLQEAVRDLVTSQEYQDLPIGVNMNGYKYSSSEATKLNAIRSIFIEYNNAALQNVIREYGELYIDRKGRTMSEAVEEVNNEKLNQSINEGLEHNIGNQIKRFGQ